MIFNHLRSFAAVLVLTIASAHAATVTDTMDVTLTILDSCSLTANNLDFGNASDLDSNIDVTTTLDVNCSTGTPYTIGIDDGVNGSRVLSDGASSSVSYEIFRTAARVAPWGIISGVDTVGGVGTGSSQTLTVYGRVPSQSLTAPGSYSDTLTVTVTF